MTKKLCGPLTQQ